MYQITKKNILYKIRVIALKKQYLNGPPLSCHKFRLKTLPYTYSAKWFFTINLFIKTIYFDAKK